MTDEFRLSDPPDNEAEAPPAAVVQPKVPHWGYRELFSLVAVVLLAGMLAASAAVRIFALVSGHTPDEAVALMQGEPLIAVPVQVLAWLPGLAYIAFVVKKRYARSLRQGLAWLPLTRPALSYVRTGVLLAFGSAVAGIALGDPQQSNPMQELFSNQDSLWILAAFGVLLAPVIEEVVFRGFLYGALEYLHGPWPALGGSTAVFALLHGAQYGWRWQQLSVLLAVGAILGLVRMRGGSTKASTIVHVAYNGLLFLVLISVGDALG